jgi:thiosulfate dehydrogenase
MKRALSFTFFALLGALCLLAAARSAGGVVNGDAIRGGRIYDNWMLALDLTPPEANHPLWGMQETNPRSGVATWRCVECHGWDYKGVDGAFGPYSTHYTGFPGLQGMVGATETEVLDWLSGSINPAHNFLFYTNTTALLDLAAFLRTQQVDMDLLIDPYTGAALGDHQAGEQLYAETCLNCHGPQGDLINFGSDLSPLYLADLAVSDPWQTVHKIRFGTPTTSRMPASEELGLSLSRVADVLAYAQTLRRGNPALTPFTSVSEGPVQVERQGEIEPLIWGAFIILAIVGFSLLSDLVREGRLTFLPRKPEHKDRR